MKSPWLQTLVVLALVGTGWVAVQAQEVVHAVSGVVKSVNPDERSIAITTNNGSDGNFVYEQKLKENLEFDRSIQDGTLEPNSFNKIGDHVVAYYIDKGAQRTIVAIKDFGPTGLNVTSGTVVKTKHHEMTLKTDKGATQTFNIAKDASAETPMGVVSGLRFDPSDGESITVRYSQENGSNVAQFIRTN
jgi:hypothetical protein